MRSTIALGVLLGCAAAVAFAQSPSSSFFPRGSSLQSWQNPGQAAVLARCQKPPQPFSIPGGQAADAAPPAPLLGIVFFGAWGTPGARNQIVAIPNNAQGYTGRAK